MQMKLGIVTPVLTRVQRSHAAWERDAGIDEVTRVVVEAERLGYHHATCSEHVAIPEKVAETRGGIYWDPLATFGYLAAHTKTIRLATFVLVLGYHHPLAIVKRYGTLDRIAKGRLILGVGVGSLEQEFALLGADFAGRGARGDDAIRALRASWGRDVPEYHGTHFDFGGAIVNPTALHTAVPIWIGGRSRRSLRRAVELGDCWAPFGISRDEIRAFLAEARTTEAWAARNQPIEVALQPDPLDPIGNRAATEAMVGQYQAAGATILNARFTHHSVEHYIEQLAALRELVPIK